MVGQADPVDPNCSRGDWEKEWQDYLHDWGNQTGLDQHQRLDVKHDTHDHANPLHRGQGNRTEQTTPMSSGDNDEPDPQLTVSWRNGGPRLVPRDGLGNPGELGLEPLDLGVGLGLGSREHETSRTRRGVRMVRIGSTDIGDDQVIWNTEPPPHRTATPRRDDERQRSGGGLPWPDVSPESARAKQHR